MSGRFVGTIFRNGAKADSANRSVNLRVRKRLEMFRQHLVRNNNKFGVITVRIDSQTIARLTIIMKGLRAIFRADIVTMAEEAQQAQAFARYVWLPQGFVFVPKTADAPLGFGLPKIDVAGELINEPYGTNDGVLRECLVNKYVNNLYDVSISETLYGPVTFTEELFDLPGIQTQEFQAQFANADDEAAFSRFEGALLFPLEAEGDNWVAHLVSEEPYTNDAEEEIFKLTNALRLSLDLDPVFRPTKGHYSPTKAWVSEVQNSQHRNHDDELFHAGYKLRKERAFKDGAPVNSGENIASYPTSLWGTQDDIAKGALFFEQWLNSPLHYDVMVHQAWNKPLNELVGAPGLDEENNPLRADTGTVLNISALQEAYITEANGVAIVPRDASLGIQVFDKRAHWLYVGNYYWRGEAGQLSWIMAAPELESNAYAAFRVSESDPACFGFPEEQKRLVASFDSAIWATQEPPKSAICLHGRRFEMPEADQNHLLMGAALRRRGTPEQLHVLAAIMNRDTRALEMRRCSVEKLERWEGEGRIEWELFDSFDLSDVFNLSIVHFSQDATKAVFKVERYSNTPVTQAIDDIHWSIVRDWPVDATPRDPLMAEFWEWSASGFALVEVVSGVTITTEHRNYAPYAYAYEAAGLFSVAKDYIDNELVTLKAVVDDSYRYDLTHVTPRKTARYNRKLVFPSGKEVVYQNSEMQDWQTTQEAVLACVDYVDLQTENVGGFRIRYETQPGVVANTRNVIATFELFFNDTILKSLSGNSFPTFREELFPMNPGEWDVEDSLGYHAYRPHRFGQNHLIEPARTGIPASPNGFIPFSSQLASWLEYTNKAGTTFYNDVRLPPMPQRVCYGSKLMPIAGGFASALGAATPYDYNEDSITQRAWSVRGAGFGLYNPSPWFGSMASLYGLAYGEEELAGGFNHKQYFVCWGQGTTEVAETATNKMALSGYETGLDLAALTGLDSLLLDDIFPIGVI